MTAREAKSRRFAIAAFSAAIVYHLLAVLSLPNSGSLESRALAPFIYSYANTLNLNTPWVFFSPGPAPNFYLEYELESSEGESLEPEPRVYPLPKTSRFYSERYNRSLYGLRYFALHPTRLEEFFGPWLCRQHPEAVSIAAQAVFEQVPGIDRAWLMDSFSDMLERTGLERKRFRCREEPIIQGDE